MASYVWEGRATAAYQTGTIQITAYDASTTYTLTIGGVTFSHTGATSPANAIGKAAALEALWDASTHPYVSGLVGCSTSGTDTLTFLAQNPGIPFTVSGSVSGGGSGTIGSYSAVVANSGPCDASTAANWINMSTGARAIPTSGDHVYFIDNDRHCLFGLDQFASTNLIVTVDSSYTGYVGLNPEEFVTSVVSNTITATDGFREYRPRYFSFVADGSVRSVFGREIGLGPFLHSGRLKFKLASGSDAVLVNATRDTSDDTGKMPLRLLTASSTLDIWIASGNVAINADQDDAETTEAQNIYIMQAPSGKSDPLVHFGGNAAYNRIEAYAGDHVYAGGGTAAACYLKNANLKLIEHPAAGKITGTALYTGASVDVNHCYMTTAMSFTFYAVGSSVFNAENLDSPTFTLNDGVTRDEVTIQRDINGDHTTSY